HLFASGAGEPVELRATRILGLTPFGIEPTHALQPLKRGKERPGIDFEDAARNLLNPASDTEAMHRFQAERFENEHVQRALDYVGAWFIHSPRLLCFILAVKM